MITIYKQEGSHLVPVTELVEKGVQWVDLFSPTEEEILAVEKRFALPIPSLEQVKEIETTSRLYQEEAAHYMTITLIAHALHPQQESLTHLTFILKENTLITLRYDEPSPLTSFAKWITNKPTIPVDSAFSLLLGLLEVSIDRLADILENVSFGVEKLSVEVFAKGKAKNFQHYLLSIGEQGHLLSNARESLVSMNLTIGYLKKTHLGLSKGRIGNIGLDIAALNDHTMFLGQKINFLLDTCFGLLNVEQTKIIKIFSVAAVMFLPPTLIASIYGMNFKKMPEINWLLGYPFALIMIIISAMLPYMYFKRKGWL